MTKSREARLVRIEEMTPEDWATVPDNPRQRNTEAHATYANRPGNHLAEYHESHQTVKMAVLPDGREYKLDAHSRDYLWQRGLLRAPEILTVEVWACPDIEKVKDMYMTNDNAKAAEQSKDRLFGAAREHDIEFNSALLRQYKFQTGLDAAVSIASGRLSPDSTPIDVYKETGNWRRELEKLDGIDPKSHLFPTGIISAALISLRFMPGSLDFWRKYNRSEGTKTPTQGKDGIQALEEFILKNRKSLKTTRDGRMALCKIALKMVLRYKKGKPVGNIQEITDGELIRLIGGNPKDYKPRVKKPKNDITVDDINTDGLKHLIESLDSLYDRA